jgi:hypothetical protein
VVHNRQMAVSDLLTDNSTKHVLNKVETGGALAITAGADATFKGTTATAGTTLSVQAGGDIDINDGNGNVAITGSTMTLSCVLWGTVY